MGLILSQFREEYMEILGLDTCLCMFWLFNLVLELCISLERKCSQSQSIELILNSIFVFHFVTIQDRNEFNVSIYH